MTAKSHASFYLHTILSSADVIRHQAGKTFILFHIDDPLFVELCEWDSSGEDAEDDDPDQL